MKTNYPILKGVVGSTAYGMATDSSDVDRYGVFVVPTLDLVGLEKPLESIVETKPEDLTMHELGKFAKLALNCNPSVLEVLWLDDYEISTRAGAELVACREAFLSKARVRDAYFGYATQQFARIKSRGDLSFSSDTRHRTAKHARHLMRLLSQGIDLYKTGVLQVRVAPDRVAAFRDFGDRVAQGDLTTAEEVLGMAKYEWDQSHCALPTSPDRYKVDCLLRNIRRDYW